ncbi:hypothetical protein HDU88_008502 [Geranomyces variabilis]|nr:hypothetical protein HDU88_008502 [Geranomyces variabilis]
MSTHVNHVSFSAARLAGTQQFKNKGVVEVMIVHSADTCSFVKRKYISALELAAAAAVHLFPHAGSRPTKTIRIKLEAPAADGATETEFLDYSAMDQSISSIERAMDRKFAVLMHLLARYGLLDEVSFPDTDWRRISFSDLRNQLVALLAARATRLQMLGQAAVRSTPNFEDLVGTETTGKGGAGAVRPELRKRGGSFQTTGSRRKENV